MVTLRLFPPGLSCARSPWPLWKATTREPPPPQPSFFTLNSSLGGKQVSVQPLLKKSWHWCECLGFFYPACHWRRLPVFSSAPPRSVWRAGWGTLSWKWTPAGCRTETRGGQKSHPVSYCAQQIQYAVREKHWLLVQFSPPNSIITNMFSCKYLSDTLEMLANSIFRFSTSLIWPFSGPFFTFSRPIR